MVTRIVLHKGYLKIYYQKSYNVLRWNTQIKAEKTEITKAGLLRPHSRSDWQKVNQYLMDKQREVDSLLLEYDFFIGRVKHELENPKVIPEPSAKALTILYQEYMEYKTNVERKITDGSAKTFWIWYSHLQDFDRFKGMMQTVDDVTDEWLHELRNFLQSNLGDEYATYGGMSDSTFHRRMKGFKSFWNWMVKRGKAFENQSLKDFKVSTHKADFIWLNDEQINALIKYQPLFPYQRNIKDIFLVLCFTGMRISDYLELESHHVKGNYIVKTSKKSKVQFKVPMHPTVREIYDKWHQSWYKINSGKINTVIKKICSELPEFQHEIRHTTWRANKPIVKKGPMWQFVSSHAGRHTACTRALIGGVPHNVIMGWLGWTNPGQLFEYADKIGLETDEYMAKL